MRTKLKIWLKRLLVASGVATFVASLWLGWAYREYVILNPGEHIDKSYILTALSKESSVLYRDGKTQLHSFYSDQHRIYVSYEEIPEYWVQAITAAEDKRFFSHFGVDPIGISRAMLSNIKAGRIVSGGSTLTQQTAKNVFNRPDRSLNSKAEEALNALRLEYHFEKEEILEFYANQFHVNGNGRGLGVAARHYFNKQVEDLSLIECAFIAGMLQGPGLYDPFVSRSYRKGMTVEEYRALNLERAQKRMQYVLGRMLAEGHISQELHDKVSTQPLPFQRGVFQYRPNAAVDEVKRRLMSPPFSEILEEYNIDNPATAGLTIVTTLDQDIQRHAQYGLVHHLSETGGILEGVEPKDLIRQKQSVILEKRRDRQVGDLFFGKVVEHSDAGIVIADGNGQCTVDNDALSRIAKVLRKAKNTKWGRTVATLKKELSIDSVVWASVKNIDDSGQYCDLELDVTLQGGVLALKQGEILAMVGGTQNMDFNRASNAKRQFGSTWKPLIYTAAMQLGWSPLDLLDNRANPFPFERVWYYPRSGHRNAEPYPSLSWTGVQSENRSSVWLLFHLTDKLSVVDYRTLIEKMGLNQQDDEDEQAFIERIRDELGVISTRANTEEIAFLAAKRELLNSRQVLDNKAWTEIDRLQFQSMLFGTGAQRELEKLKDAENKQLTASNFRMLSPIVEDCSTLVEQEIEQFILDEGHVFSDKLWWDPTRTRVGCGDVPAEWVDETEAVSISDWELWATTGLEPEIWVHGRFSHLLWRELTTEMHKQTLLLQDAAPYSMDFLQHHPDFQQIVNMRYCNYLLNNLGIEGQLPLTLTIPLGAVEITLLDAAMLYSGLLTGQRTRVEDDSQQGNMLIQRIEGPTGEVLYEAQPKTQQVSSFVSGMLLSNILHNVVQHGTARRAKKLQTDDGVPIPVIGKTGTTNGFRNAAFVGMVPKAEAGTWLVESGVTIATYVGYDANTPMRFGRYSLSGASGALPVWMETAQGVALSEFIGRPSKNTEFIAAENYYPVAVNPKNGHIDEDGSGHTWVYTTESPLFGQDAIHMRAFSPVDANKAPEWNAAPEMVLDASMSIDNARIVPMKTDVFPSELDSADPFEIDVEDARLVPIDHDKEQDQERDLRQGVE